MTPTTHGHAPESSTESKMKPDPADLPRCPMERLADRFNDAPKPTWLDRHAIRTASGHCVVYMDAELSSVEQVDEIIGFLLGVKG